MNVIGDVAGRFDELKLLLEKMPKEKTIYVGDLNDRGPKSKEVIEFVMNDPNAICLQSNHGHMMVDFYEGVKEYPIDAFLRNGGVQTLQSYDIGLHNCNLRSTINEAREKIPKKHIEWLKNLPYYYEDDKVFISHAAKNPTYSLEKVCDNSMDSYYYNILWNRGEPREIPGKLQIMGHNAHWGIRKFGNNDKPWAICVDGTRKRRITGLHVPTMTIYEQEYLD